MGMNVDNQIPDGNDHLSIQSITEWLSGECTANFQSECEQHCVRCAECREQVAMISQSTQPDEDLDPGTDGLHGFAVRAATDICGNPRDRHG